MFLPAEIVGDSLSRQRGIPASPLARKTILKQIRILSYPLVGSYHLNSVDGKAITHKEKEEKRKKMGEANNTDARMRQYTILRQESSWHCYSLDKNYHLYSGSEFIQKQNNYPADSWDALWQMWAKKWNCVKYEEAVKPPITKKKFYCLMFCRLSPFVAGCKKRNVLTGCGGKYLKGL